METFFALLALCVGNSPVTGEFPSQRPVTRSFDYSLIRVWKTAEYTFLRLLIWDAIMLTVMGKYTHTNRKWNHNYCEHYASDALLSNMSSNNNFICFDILMILL